MSVGPLGHFEANNINQYSLHYITIITGINQQKSFGNSMLISIGKYFHGITEKERNVYHHRTIET